MSEEAVKEERDFWANRVVNTGRKEMVKDNGAYYITSSAALFSVAIVPRLNNGHKEEIC